MLFEMLMKADLVLLCTAPLLAVSALSSIRESEKENESLFFRTVGKLY